MSKTNIKTEIINLYKDIEKKEKDKNKDEGNKNEDSDKYKKINKSIQVFIENKTKNWEENTLTKDIIESLKILKLGYENKSKNIKFSKDLLEKEQLILKCHETKKEKESNYEENEENEDEDTIKGYEVITTEPLEEIIRESIAIQKLLNECKIKAENSKINELNNNISNIIVESNKLMHNKKLIDEEAIKRLNEQIKAIKREYDKIAKKKKNKEYINKNLMYNK